MPNQLFKLLVGVSICSALPLPLDFTHRAWADVRFPVAEVGSSLAGKTSVPLFLPESLPFDRDVYFTAKVTPTGYNIEMSATPDCRGVTACFIGSLVAERDGKRSEPTSGLRQEYQRLTLTDGVEGAFFKSCGAYCTALVEWEYQGVLYRVFMKNGDLETLQEIANRAIASGPRSFQGRSTAEYILQQQGVLGPGSAVLASDNSFYEEYTFRGNAGQSITISLESQEFDTYLALFSPDNQLLQENDDINNNNSNSQIVVTLPQSGVYRIIVNTYDEQGRGRYTLTVR